MSIESREPQFRVEPPPKPENAEVAQAERDLNEIIPILAHGLVRRIEQKGFSGKVRVRATAGDEWGVAKSPDNPTDVPNVIIYPRESLSGDKRLTNARLRHEIGNLNYPIDSELNGLRDWCETHDIAPELLTALVEATHEASVNYLEMQNSHSDRPEENFRSLYEHDINTQQIADNIGQSAPYKQAVDIALLYSLSQTGLIPKEQFEQALAGADPSVQEAFDKQTRSVLDQTVKMAVPKKQVQLVRDYLWPKFSKLIAPSAPGKATSTGEAEAQLGRSQHEGAKGEKGKEASAKQAQMKEMQERLQKMMEKMRQQSQRQKQTRQSQQQKSRQEQKESKQEQKSPKQKEISAAEKQERAEEENLLAQNLQEQLQTAREQIEQLQKPGAKPEAPKKPQDKPSSMEDIGKQAEQMKQQAEQAMHEAKEAADEITEEQLQKLKEQLEQMEEVAKQIAESGALEEELAKPEEEPMTYNIKEYGIDEAQLTPEQLENLQKTRSFAQNTSRVYRTAMRLLMKGYQQHNPKFTDRMMQKMMERGYDLPDFSLYGSQAAQEFLSEREELGIDGFSDNFLINFQLPKPLAKFWYKGGNGSKSVPVKEGEIEWGHFYRMCMPVIYSGVDRSQMSGLYLNRLNQFGQHDPKKYYYLWETINLEQERKKQEEEALKEMQEQLQQMKEKLDEMSDQSAGKTSDEKSEQSGQKSESAESQKQQGQKSGDQEQASSQSKESVQQGEKSEKSEQKSGEQKQSGQEQQSAEQGGDKPSPQELKKQIDDLKEQVDQMIKDAEERGDQAQAQELKEMKEQLEQMAEKLEQGEQGEKGESGEQGEGEGQESEGQEGQPGEGQGQEGQGEGSESQGEGSGQPGSGQGQGQGQGEGGEGSGKGQGQSQGGQPGKGMGQGKGEGQPGGQLGGQGGQMGQGTGEPGGFESGSGGMPSAQEMQELVSQMQDMLNQAKGQGGAPGSQESIQQMLDKLAEMQENLQSGASPQELADQMSQAMQEMSDMIGGQEGGESGQEGQGQQSGESGGESGQESSGEGSDQSGGESGEQSHEQFQKGGKTHEGEGMFSKPNEELLRQLRQAEQMVGSKFSTKDESGNFAAKDLSSSVSESLKSQMTQTEQVHARQLETLEELKRQQELKMEAMYREMSGLDGEALRVYVDYMESTKEFTNDLTEFFIDKFKLDKEYLYERNQRRGARLQRGFTQNILGQKESRMVINPRSFERKRPPEKPQFAWTLIIDNSGSCSGEIIEQEKKLAVALVEVAKTLDIPLEIVTFGGPDQFTFLKTFEQNIAGEDLQKVVLLNADQGTPDVATLDAACTSMEKFSDKFKRSYNFVYFMTDGQSGSGSIQEVIKKHKKDMVITGIGMAGAAQTIAQTWGKNAVEVPDVKKLSDAFIRKVEDQIDQTFD